MELTGRVTKDAVIKTLPDERQVISFSIAVNDYVKKKGAAEGEQLTQFFDCSYWKGTGVSARLLKGILVTLNGRMQARAYTNSSNEPKAAVNFHCDSIKVHGLTGKQETASDQPQQEEKGKKPPIENIVTITEPMEDMPF